MLNGTDAGTGREPAAGVSRYAMARRGRRYGARSARALQAVRRPSARSAHYSVLIVSGIQEQAAACMLQSARQRVAERLGARAKEGVQQEQLFHVSRAAMSICQRHVHSRRLWRAVFTVQPPPQYQEACHHQKKVAGGRACLAAFQCPSREREGGREREEGGRAEAGLQACHPYEWYQMQCLSLCLCGVLAASSGVEELPGR